MPVKYHSHDEASPVGDIIIISVFGTVWLITAVVFVCMEISDCEKNRYKGEYESV